MAGGRARRARSSCCIELSQKLFLPGRVASIGDVLANTAGALIGTAVAVLLRLVIQYRDRLVVRDVLEGRRPLPPADADHAEPVEPERSA